MKRLFLCGILLCCLLGLDFPARALTYQDDMTDLAGSTIKSYTNLKEFPMTGSGYSSLPDRSALTFGSTSNLRAWASYRVRGGESITVGIYTSGGTFVSPTPWGSTALGIFQDGAAIPAGPRTQALYSPSVNGVFADIGGAFHQAEFNGSYYEFFPAPTPSDGIGYAVNVYFSANGQTFTPISLTPTRLSHTPQAPLCYEELSGLLPKNAEYIRVEINDVDRYPIHDRPGEFQFRSYLKFTCLTSVSISGSDLAVGIPEKVVPESTPDSVSQSSAAQSSSKPASKASSEAATPAPGQSSGTAAKSSSSAASVSKFEGVIESSAAAGQQKTTSSTASASHRSSTTPEPQEETAYSQQASLEIYEIPRHGQDASDYFSTGILVYILVVVSALVFILINGWIKKK